MASDKIMQAFIPKEVETRKKIELLDEIVSCRKSYVQEYECQAIKKLNGKEIAFDACLAKELFWLWDLGIITNGSCCGKHVNSDENTPAYIGVESKFRDKMLDLGYTELDNKNHFIPKTIF